MLTRDGQIHDIRLLEEQANIVLPAQPADHKRGAPGRVRGIRDHPVDDEYARTDINMGRPLAPELAHQRGRRAPAHAPPAEFIHAHAADHSVCQSAREPPGAQLCRAVMTATALRYNFPLAHIAFAFLPTDP